MGDVEKLIKEDESLKEEVLLSLTEARDSEVDRFAKDLHKELAARTQDKEKEEAELKRKEELVQARREEERLRREEEARKAEEERLEIKRSGPPRKKPVKRSSSSDMSVSKSRSRDRGKSKGKKKKEKRPPTPSDSEDSRKPKKGAKKKNGG